MPAWGHLTYYKKKDGNIGIETPCPKCSEVLVSFDDETTALPFELREDKDSIEIHGFIHL